MRKLSAGIALALAGTLALAACGTPTDDKPAATGSSTADGGSTAAASDFLACMVSDSGGFQDKSFNENSYNGLQNAVKALGIKEADVQSSSEADFVPNINSLVQKGCNIIVTVGFLLNEATYDAAKANPNIYFAIVDNAPSDADGKPSTLPNLRGLTFDTAQAAFMAGYASAAMSKSGTVATFGGMKIPTVTIFMDGYVDGVNYYNTKTGKDIKVLGWNIDTQEGVFTNDFEDQSKGKSTTQDFIAQGADVIHPVAGPVGLGALSAAKDAAGTMIVWPDADGAISNPDYASIILTSVQKKMDVAVEATITDAFKGTFDNKNYVGTLANDGVALAPFHDFESQVPDTLKAELKAIQEGIIDGSIKVNTKATVG